MLLDAIQGHYGVRPGETTADGKISILTARCVGSCGLAPVAVVDGQVAGLLDPSGLVDRIEALVKS